MRAGLADEVLSIAGDADDLESRAFEDADYALLRPTDPSACRPGRSRS